MKDHAPETGFGMPREAAQSLHKALGKALETDTGTGQLVTVSIKQETIEHFQSLQSQNLPIASAVIFITEPRDEDAESESDGEHTGNESE